MLPFVAAIILFTPDAWNLVPSDVGVSALPALPALRYCCALHLVLLLVVSYRFWGFGVCRRRYLILYPLSVILAQLPHQ